MRSPKTIAVSLFFLLVVSAIADHASAESEPVSATIFLVRHAEKATDDEDPELTQQGKQRADTLALMLRDARVERIYSTNYRRTLNTAAPLANDLNLAVEIYEWDELSSLATMLRKSGENSLVVGHSNTTPEMVELLGGDPGTEIDEKSEYDRFYVVTIGPDGVSSVLLRYGTE